MLRLSASLLLAAAFNSCTTAHQPNTSALTDSSATTSVATATAQATEPVLVFRKTPCMGPCPVYTATLFANGRVQYEGQRNVPLTGPHTLQLSPDSVAALRRTAEQLGFGTLASVYKTQLSDLPSTYLSVLQPGGTLKQVRVDSGAEAPAALTQLLATIERQLDRIAVAKQ